MTKRTGVHDVSRARRIRRATVVALVAGLSAITAGVGRTQGPSLGVPAIPTDVRAAKAYQALERNCAGCHQAGRSDGRTAGGLDSILALSEISREAALVRPGLPDASRLYNVALTRERHVDVLNDPGLPEATALEVQDIRDWIAELKPQAACAVGERLDAAGQGRLMSDALRGLEPETARMLRFASLAHLANACVPASEIARFDRALAELSAGAHGPKMFAPIDPARLVWRFSLRDLGWTAADWEARIAAYPLRDAPGLAIPPAVAATTGTAVPVVAADWLLDLMPDGKIGTTSHWWKSGDAVRLSAEMWLSPEALAERLKKLPPVAALPARRLLGGDAVGRADLDWLSALLAGRKVVPDPAEHSAVPLEIALWSDKTTYKAGELAQFSVTANRDCYLTLVGVDRGGRATVLFPSEFEPANLLARGVVLSVPAADAAYKFRFREKGRETIVAICSATHKAPLGVYHDYDRLRFTVLGDWQLFLREPTEMKDARRDDAATDTPRPQVTQRRRGRTGGSQKGPAPMPGFDIQTRTAISITIE